MAKEARERAVLTFIFCFIKLSVIAPRHQALSKFPSYHFHFYTTTLKSRLLMNSSEISKFFGKDSSTGGIGFQFREIKRNAKLQRACADAGGDPQTLNIGTGEKGAFSFSFITSSFIALREETVWCALC